MTEVFINGIGWIEVPEIPPERVPGRWRKPWSYRDIRILEALLWTYGFERAAWALDRSVPAVKAFAHKMDWDCSGLYTCSQTLKAKRLHDYPRPDTLGRVA